MSYSTDKPIEKQDDDKLERKYFSNQLGKAIYEYKDKDGLVIGLFGEWGTGKTSVVNMVEQGINELSEENGNKPIIERFSPWNYTDKNNLISLFFQDLRIQIYKQSGKSYYEKIGYALEEYSEALDLLNYVPFIGSGVVTTIKVILKKIIKKVSKKSDLNTTKKDLEKVLKDEYKKIIVVIDDIDRLTNLQIIDVFQLVKQVADFPNVIYLLVMDRTVVERALNAVHDINGSAYLEKIIQVPIELPKLNKSKLEEIFLDRLKTILEDSLIMNTGIKYLLIVSGHILVI